MPCSKLAGLKKYALDRIPGLLLENYSTKDGNLKCQRKASEVVVHTLNGFIENDECINACGLDRNTVEKAHILILYLSATTNLSILSFHASNISCAKIIYVHAGVHLPNLCADPCRAMYQIRSNGDAAPACANVCWSHFSRLEVIAGVAWIQLPFDSVNGAIYFNFIS
ncbi:hypothetical protein SADUNF_Sadunf16G0136900 [Salix dunnii]|uniref:Uncharacterized protein n=1 Tax=Salix dunnii TaxID=1413687 RepID=A0A835MLR1_9ROSI|nr:hypothetical protein SADUNF_Sadunf16G0136900 [Salix dunnii]